MHAAKSTLAGIVGGTCTPLEGTMNEITQSTNVARPRMAQADHSHVAGQSGRGIVLGRLVLRILPNLLIVGALVGLACWGHETGWKLPGVAELTGNAGDVTDDWCVAHAVPESA